MLGRLRGVGRPSGWRTTSVTRGRSSPVGESLSMAGATSPPTPLPARDAPRVVHPSWTGLRSLGRAPCGRPATVVNPALASPTSGVHRIEETSAMSPGLTLCFMSELAPAVEGEAVGDLARAWRSSGLRTTVTARGASQSRSLRRTSEPRPAGSPAVRAGSSGRRRRVSSARSRHLSSQLNSRGTGNRSGIPKATTPATVNPPHFTWPRSVSTNTDSTPSAPTIHVNCAVKVFCPAV